MLSHHGGIRLNADTDRAWVIVQLSDTGKPIFEWEMMLWAAMIEVANPSDHILKALRT